MKQNGVLKWYSKIIFAFALILVSISLIIHVKYDVFLNQYLAYSGTLTQEERQYLKEKETIVFGVDFKSEPYFFIDAETGEFKGLLKTYIDDMAKDMEVNVQYVDKSLYDIEDSSYNEKVDVTEVYFNKELRKNFSLSQSIYTSKGVMVANYDSDLCRYMDMSSVKMAIVNGTYAENDIERGLPKDSYIEYVFVDSIIDGIKALEERKVDALAGNKNIIERYSRELDIGTDQRVVRNELYKGDIVLASNAYDTMLNNILNKEIMRLKKNRLYMLSQEEWLGSAYFGDAESASIRWIGWIMMLCVLLVILLMIWEAVLNKRIEEKTHQIGVEKKNLQTVVDNINALVAVVSKSGIILACNGYGKRMLNDSSDSFIGSHISTVDMLNELNLMYNQDPNKAFYYYHDKYYHVNINSIKQGEDNQLLLITDYTEQTIAEQKVRQESKMIAVGQLSAGLTHEIRNPLGLIKTYSYLLDDYAIDEMSKHALKVISESVSRIDNLIDNLLSFSKLSNDKPVRFNVTQMIYNIIELGKKTLEKENVTIDFQKTKDIIVTTLDEPVKIVIYNLMNNAVEAFREAGQVDGVITIRQNSEKGVLTIIVKDNGPGMNEETVENIFNPFFTTKETGTGLGLYIVITELKKINGQIRVKSQIGKGTEFTVEIPVRN